MQKWLLPFLGIASYFFTILPSKMQKIHIKFFSHIAFPHRYLPREKLIKLFKILGLTHELDKRIHIPRWLVAKVISKPSSLTILFGSKAIPALFISRSRRFSPKNKKAFQWEVHHPQRCPYTSSCGGGGHPGWGAGDRGWGLFLADLS